MRDGFKIEFFWTQLDALDTQIMLVLVVCLVLLS